MFYFLLGKYMTKNTKMQGNILDIFFFILIRILPEGECNPHFSHVFDYHSPQIRKPSLFHSPCTFHSIFLDKFVGPKTFTSNVDKQLHFSRQKCLQTISDYNSVYISINDILLEIRSNLRFNNLRYILSLPLLSLNLLTSIQINEHIDFSRKYLDVFKMLNRKEI